MTADERDEIARRLGRAVRIGERLEAEDIEVLNRKPKRRRRAKATL